MSKPKRAIDIRIENITEAQAIAIESLLATWQSLGGLGASRWTAFYADGDGNFRPRITVDGRKAEHTTLMSREELWKNEHGHSDEYRIDYDVIAWRLRQNEANI